MIGIYKITSPTNRIYIGQSKNIKYRFDTYRRLGKNVSNSPKLYRSLCKYGYINHKFEIIEECTIESINERERYWQDFYNATSDKNLNCILTKTNKKKGVGRKLSIEQKKQISLVHKGKKVSEETREKIKIARSKQIITEDHKRKISENSGCARIVLDTNTGVFYNSAKELSKLYNINHNSLICRLIGRVKNKSQFIYV
jgi:group I intron endonuclease